MRTILSTIPSESIGRAKSFLRGGLEHDERRREVVAVRQRNPRVSDAELLRARGRAAVQPQARSADRRRAATSISRQPMPRASSLPLSALNVASFAATRTAK